MDKKISDAVIFFLKRRFIIIKLRHAHNFSRRFKYLIYFYFPSKIQIYILNKSTGLMCGWKKKKIGNNL